MALVKQFIYRRSNAMIWIRGIWDTTGYTSAYIQLDGNFIVTCFEDDLKNNLIISTNNDDPNSHQWQHMLNMVDIWIQFVNSLEAICEKGWKGFCLVWILIAITSKDESHTCEFLEEYSCGPKTPTQTSKKFRF